MLDTQPHLQACDDFYEALLAAHEGLTTPQSHAMNARLVLLLANHIGDQATLAQALALARGTVPPAAAPVAAQDAATPCGPAATA
jgi:hypothetical protein